MTDSRYMPRWQLDTTHPECHGQRRQVVDLVLDFDLAHRVSVIAGVSTAQLCTAK
jgi:hypothetical protein